MGDFVHTKVYNYHRFNIDTLENLIKRTNLMQNKEKHWIIKQNPMSRPIFDCLIYTYCVKIVLSPLNDKMIFKGRVLACADFIN